jgi:hypothetical protein
MVVKQGAGARVVLPRLIWVADAWFSIQLTSLETPSIVPASNITGTDFLLRSPKPSAARLTLALLDQTSKTGEHTAGSTTYHATSMDSLPSTCDSILSRHSVSFLRSSRHLCASAARLLARRRSFALHGR